MDSPVMDAASRYPQATMGITSDSSNQKNTCRQRENLFHCSFAIIECPQAPQKPGPRGILAVSNLS